MRARLVLAALAVLVVSAPSPARAVPTPIAVAAAGSDGSGRIEDGRSCADGGDGRYWHYEYDSPLAPGAFTQRAAELRLHLDLHHDQGQANAFLLENESHASLLDDRGTIRVRLRSAAGSCTDVPSLPFDTATNTVAGTGTWEVDDTAGAYAGATGSGTFDLTAAVAPGADNPWALDLNGEIDVPAPALTVQVVRTYWASLGTDYLSRRPTVVYRITNSGTGAAYGSRLTSATSSTPGVSLIGPVPQTLGDLAPGETVDIAVRYQLGLLQPCAVVILNCPFTTALGVGWTDALDRPLNPVAPGLAAQAPNLPPPL